MKNKFKTCVSLLIALLMIAALLPAGIVASADEGTCGENLTWTLDDDGLLRSAAPAICPTICSAVRGTTRRRPSSSRRA